MKKAIGKRFFSPKKTDEQEKKGGKMRTAAGGRNDVF
jgi:hypothetical protein